MANGHVGASHRNQVATPIRFRVVEATPTKGTTMHGTIVNKRYRHVRQVLTSGSTRDGVDEAPVARVGGRRNTCPVCALWPTWVGPTPEPQPPVRGIEPCRMS